MNLSLTRARAEWLRDQLQGLRNQAAGESQRLTRIAHAPVAAEILLRNAGTCSDMMDAIDAALNGELETL